jgi:hypothetical protein
LKSCTKNSDGEILETEPEACIYAKTGELDTMNGSAETGSGGNEAVVENAADPECMVDDRSGTQRSEARLNGDKE